MKVLCYFPGALPCTTSGAEYYNHEVITRMISWGWEVRVCLQGKCSNGPIPYYSWAEMHQWVREGWPDICISTHYHYRHMKAKCPVYVIQHSLNFQPFPFSHVRMIYCAEHVQNAHADYMAKLQPELRGIAASMVFRPPIRLTPVEKPRKAAGGYITAINLADEKGGNDFKTLCALMPEHEFLGVQGAYGSQRLSRLPNVRYWANSPDILKVYGHTAILCMFSKFEGLPTIALEAMSQGIPVVSYPIPGAVEACGEAGVYVNNPHEVPAAIARILEDYATHSAAALQQYKKIKGAQCWECLKDYLSL